MPRKNPGRETLNFIEFESEDSIRGWRASRALPLPSPAFFGPWGGEQPFSPQLIGGEILRGDTMT